jgi:hypothetical protein
MKSPQVILAFSGVGIAPARVSHRERHKTDAMAIQSTLKDTSKTLGQSPEM